LNRSGKVTLTVKGLVNELYLDDLRAKTHRGLEGRVARGMSTGGRLFGYRTVAAPEEARASKRETPARFEIHEREADVVRRGRPVARPPAEWIRQDRPDLCIVEDALWQAVQTRPEQLRGAFGSPRRPPRGGARPMYSRYLLAGLLRCAVCGARMRGQTMVRRNRATVYRAGWCRCGFAADKGPTVCGHRVWYRQDRLEGALVAKSREAMTQPIVDALARAVNNQLDARRPRP
jgi:hypothetical protein